MTEKDKRLAIIGGTILLAVIILLFFRRGTVGSTTGSAATLPVVTGPTMGPIYLGGSSPTFTIPGLDLSGPNLNMIGACCSDCMQSPMGFTSPKGPVIANTYNLPGGGPITYDYSTAGNYSDGFDINWASAPAPTGYANLGAPYA